MDTLPELFRNSQGESILAKRRQGLAFALQLDRPHKHSSISTQKSVTLRKTTLSVNRYSIDKPSSKLKKIFNSTVSYQLTRSLNFSGSRNGHDMDSLQVLLEKDQKLFRTLEVKMKPIYGVKESYLEDLKTIKQRFENEIIDFENQTIESIISLRKFMHQLRRQTAEQTKIMKREVKEVNQHFLECCQAVQSIGKNLSYLEKV